MKRYRSHKVVEAAPILRASTFDNTVTIKDDASNDHTIIMPIGFFARGEPQPGDYLVRYQLQGYLSQSPYLSWSPKAVFEDGYTAE